MPRYIENKLIEEFKERDVFSREELFNFFRNFEPELKEGTFGWRIYNLKNKGIIKSVKRGLYTISYKSKYRPHFTDLLIRLSKTINERYSELTYCIWSTNWINEFSQHQASKEILIIEIEKDFVESLYYYLKDQFKYDIYLNPDENTISFYVTESLYPVVIKNLITRSPLDNSTEKHVKIYFPTLEKILVDLFADPKLFYFYQGTELIHIYENAITKYTLNFTKLFSYAKRRGKQNDIKLFMLDNLGPLLKDIIND
ncbi:MAG TPA: DUF6577 family protein [Bacteroidales bacterium]|nr:DUF6577 family protein [Bacteroidales bacterium]